MTSANDIPWGQGPDALRREFDAAVTAPAKPEDVSPPAKYEVHPAADIFPLMEDMEFSALVEDIKQHGLREPIVTFEGQILDGRNRYRACQQANVEPQFEAYEGDNPLAFVISLNLKRRHLNESQRAAVAARLANMVQGERNDLQPSANLQKVSQADAAKLLNVSTRSVASAVQVRDHAEPELRRAVDQGKLAVSEAAAASKLTPNQQRDVAEKAFAGDANAARTVVKKGVRAAREADLGQRQVALPDKNYGVIYADPPWRMEPYSWETGGDRNAVNHYPTQTVDAIASLDVASIAATDCALSLWATVPMLQEALHIMTAWGFTYRSSFVWVKDHAGTGYWNRNKHELLLVGVRGEVPAPAPGTQWPSAIEAPVREHSAKPEKFLEIIEAYFPTLPKIELNRRGPARPGWDAWGLEAVCNDARSRGG